MSKMEVVYNAIKKKGIPPFGDALELRDALKDSGLSTVDISIAFSRLLTNDKIRLAPDGIRTVPDMERE